MEELDPLTYDEIATIIGYRIMNFVGIMDRVGLTTLQHFIKTYLDPSQTDNLLQRDFERWLKWSLSPKNSEDRKHLYPAQFVEVCRELLAQSKLG